jgi:SAM-dependent methyltransferase/glycosyltransferase involved in cell wall biosynthesis
MNGAVNLLVRFISFKHQELHRFAQRCFPWYTVVDFGCGNGAYSAYFLHHARSTVIAVDWSFEALQALPQNDRRCLAVCADLHVLPFKPGSIDALFSIDTIGHLRNQEAALDEINRICRSGVPLFLHSECSDYRERWPDKMLIARLKRDALAEIDGHFGIQPSGRMRMLFEQRFAITDFYSPAGILGWLLGYPEKYTPLFRMAGRPFFAFLTEISSYVKSIPLLKYAVRCVNICTNRLEMGLGMNGGGSCFARGRTLVSERMLASERTLIPRLSIGGAVVSPIDIIIPTWGRPHRISHLVMDLLGQCTPDDRIVIVWQGIQKPQAPDDHRVGLLNQKIPNLPAARNAGLRSGGAPMVLFIDDDCEVQGGLLDAHRHCYSDPSIGAVAGFIDDPLFVGDFPEPSSFNSTNGKTRQNFHTNRSCVAISLMGANMSFRRSVLEKIGGFDTQYIHNALWEDVDASFRVQNAGYVLWYCSEARVRHLRQQTGGCRSDTSAGHLYYFFRNTAYFACTYAPRVHAVSWVRFWMYHLEYFSRKDYTPVWRLPFKHNPRLVAAGLTGAIAGCVAWATRGARRTIPAAVEERNNVAEAHDV